MRYQLVLQVPVSSIEDYDEIVALEETIIGELGELGCVDGHDAGCGEMNIFIYTDEPQQAFEQIKPLLMAQEGLMSRFKVAYRVNGQEDFVVIQPLGLARFEIA